MPDSIDDHNVTVSSLEVYSKDSASDLTGLYRLVSERDIKEDLPVITG